MKLANFPKFLSLNNVKYLRIFRIQQFGILINFLNFTIWKINFSQYQKILNILGVQIITKN